MAAIKSPKNRALAALTSAALSLPGLDAFAAVPVANAQGNVEYGNYQESSNRMNVQIYHVDGLVPLTDRLELAFSYDRDTYSGATPAYSLPATMVNQSYDTTGFSSNYYQNQLDAHLPTAADVVTSASTISPKTLMGNYPDSTSGLPNFQSFWEGENALYQTNPEYYDNKYLDSSGNVDLNKLTTSKEFVLAGIQNTLNSFVPKGTQPVQRFGTQPLETRTQPTLAAKYYFDNTTLGLSGGQSDEPDYISNFGAINFSHEFNEKKTTFSGGYNIASNAIFRNQGMSMAPPGVGLGMVMPADCSAAGNCLPTTRLNQNSSTNGMNLGLTQVLSKNTLFNASLGYTNQAGYLSNPYKAVYVRGEVTADEYYQLYNSFHGGSPVNWSSITKLDMLGVDLFRETRPNQRNQFNVSTGLNQYIPALDASLHVDYRFYADDWKVVSHTFEFKWVQPLPFGITATPEVRYYSQSQAEFFAPYFLAPRADGHYSSDYRLSAFGSLNTGITLAKQIGKGIKLEAGIDYYMHESSLKLGGGGSGSYADFNYYMAHAGLNIDLSAPASLFGGGDDSSGHEHHHHHTHFGSLPPAGVMFGHMMHQSNDVMIGYMYMNSRQGGAMLHGSQSVSDAVLAQGASIPIAPGSMPVGGFPSAQQIAGLNDACPGYGAAGIKKFTDFGCLIKPTSMVMGMHMFDFMYAPTDWLNLMVMPQLVDMNMSMSGDLRTPMGQKQSMDWMNNSTVNEVMNPGDTASMYSGMKHNVFDLGDTILMALIKVFDDDHHHLHIGLGGSAPTGSVSEVHYQMALVPVPGGINPNTGQPGSSMLGPFYPVNIKVLQDIGMQAGSGTWDFKPSLTYNGQAEDVFWGAQYSSVNRFQDHNKSGYALGDTYQATAWAGYSMFDWVSATVRGIYTQQNKVRGDIYQINAAQILTGTTSQIGHDTVSTVNYPQNTGGHYWDVGLGVRLMAPNGAFAGHTVSFEWLQPVQDVVNGYQLERTGTFTTNWTYMF